MHKRAIFVRLCLHCVDERTFSSAAIIALQCLMSIERQYFHNFAEWKCGDMHCMGIKFS